MTQSAYILDQKTMQWKRDREQKGLRCNDVRRQSTTLRHDIYPMSLVNAGTLPAPPGTMAHAEVAVVLLQAGWSIFTLVSGPREMERRWYGVQLCFHWLESEQVKWSSVMLLAVEHNALLFKRQTVRCFSSFYPDTYWHICNHSNYGWKNWDLVVFKLLSE